MAQLLSRRDMALLRQAGCRAASSNRSCKLAVTAFKNGSEHESRRRVKPQSKELKAGSTEQVEAKEQGADQAKVQFQLPHHVEWGQDVCLVGEADELGAWDVGKCIPMAWHDGDVWTAEAQLPAGAHFEYKYVVREGDGEGKFVAEWQPCMNLDLTADKGELTLRDTWEGQHEVHAGMLPIPVPPPTPETEADQQAPAADDSAAAALTLTPAPAAAAVPEAPADDQQQQQVEVHEAAFATPRIAAASIELEQPVLTAEEIAAAEVDSSAAAAAPAVLGGSSSSSKAAMAAQVMGTAVEEEMEAHIRQPHKGAVTPSWLAEQSPKQMPQAEATSAAQPDSASHKAKPKSVHDTSKPATGAAAAAAAKPKVSYADLPTSELKSLCKQRGLSMKGQRASLLLRLQQHKA